jgi:hypothetical protein
MAGRGLAEIFGVLGEQADQGGTAGGLGPRQERVVTAQWPWTPESVGDDLGRCPGSILEGAKASGTPGSIKASARGAWTADGCAPYDSVRPDMVIWYPGGAGGDAAAW